jgi:hypothetical protein
MVLAMPEVRVIVQPVKVDYTCDACGGAQLQFDGIVLTSNPPKYPHTCPACGARKTLPQRYPHFDYNTLQ